MQGEVNSEDGGTSKIKTPQNISGECLIIHNTFALWG